MYRILLLGVCLFFGCSAFSQRIEVNQVFGLGATIGDISGHGVFQNGNVITTSQFSLRVKQYGFTWGPRVDLLGTKGISLSLATPIFLGVSTTSRYHSVNVDTTTKVVDGIRGTSLAFEIPVFADINIGMRSASDPSRNRFGVFGGIGYAYHYTRVRVWKGADAGPVEVSSTEPIVRAGIRMGTSWERRWSISFSMRGNFNRGAEKTYGLQLLKEL